MIFKLIPFKLKGFIALSSVATCGASVTVSSNTISSDVRDCLKETVDTATTQITSLTQTAYDEYLKGSYEKFKEKFKDTDIKEIFSKDNAKKIPEKYKGWGQTAYDFAKQKFSNSASQDKQDQSSGGIRDTLETVNYYAFQYAAITTQVLQKIHVILTDTLAEVVKEQSGKSTADLISAQKIKAIYDSTEIREIAGGLAMSYMKFSNLFSQITGQQVSEAIKVMFATDTSGITEHLKKIKNNVDKLKDQEQTKISNTEKLLKFIFVGDNAEETIKTTAGQAKTLVEGDAIQTLLKDLVGESDMTNLTNILQEISGSPATTPATQ